MTKLTGEQFAAAAAAAAAAPAASTSSNGTPNPRIGGLFYAVWQRIALFCRQDVLDFKLSKTCTDLKEIAENPIIAERHGYHIVAYRYRQNEHFADITEWKEGRLERIGDLSHYREQRGGLILQQNNHSKWHSWKQDDSCGFDGHIRRLQVFLNPPYHEGRIVPGQVVPHAVVQNEPTCVMDIHCNEAMTKCLDVSNYARVRETQPQFVRRAPQVSVLEIDAIPAFTTSDWYIVVSYKARTPGRSIVIADWSRPWSWMIEVNQFTNTTIHLRRNINSGGSDPQQGLDPRWVTGETALKLEDSSQDKVMEIAQDQAQKRQEGAKVPPFFSKFAEPSFAPAPLPKKAPPMHRNK